MDSWRGFLIIPGICAVALTGCAGKLSPVEAVLRPTEVEISGREHHDLKVEAAADARILVTVRSRDIDVRVALVGANGSAPGSPVDAPNRRMGVESLLVEPPHGRSVLVRVEGNDHREAHGLVTVAAIALPASSRADRRRLEAARLESTAGWRYGDLGQGEAAATAYAAAAALHGRNGEGLHAGMALLHAAGARYARLADWRGAAESAARAGRMLDRADAPELTAFALRLEGAALDLAADAGDIHRAARKPLIERARRRLTEAAERFGALGMPYEAGYALNYRGVSHQDAGERNRARADFQQALALFRSAQDVPAQALSLQSLAMLSHEEGLLADAVRTFDQALALIPRDEEPENYAHTLHNSALPLRVLGRFDEAIARFYEAGQILHRLGDRAGEARALHGLGTTFRHTGEPDRARDLLRAAIALRGDAGARREQATSLVVLGEIEREAGHRDLAIELHEQAAALASAAPDRAKVLLALAQDHAAAADLAAARHELEAILQLGLPPTHRYRGLTLTELGDIESRQGHTQAAARAFAGAIAVHQANGSALEEARARYRRAAAVMRAGDTAAVLADTAAALRLFDEVGLQWAGAENRAMYRASYRAVVELRIAAVLAEAAILQRRGDASRAQRLLREALATSDRSHARLLTESGAVESDLRDLPPELLPRRQEVYELLVGKRERQERLLEAAAPDLQQLAALRREIALLRAEVTLIENHLARTRPESPGSPAAEIEELVRAVPPDVVVAEYFLGDRQGWLFEVRNREVLVHPLTDAARLDSSARQLYLAWRSLVDTSDDRLAVGRELARRLLAPLGNAMPGRELWIVPDGALHLVPLAQLAELSWPAMPSGAALVIPSLSAKPAPRAVHGPAPRRWLAVIADPVYTADDPRIHLASAQAAAAIPIRLAGDAPLTRSAREWNSLQRLPSTAIEARDLLALVENPAESLALIGPDASRVRVTNAPLREYRILHFATHALADSQDPALAALALSRWDAAGNPVNGDLRLYDINRLRLDADLVVLSGCDTAVGREIAGEGPIGLAQAFLQSGARSVVATLWQVPDTSTAELMREFYRQLLGNGRDTAAALQLAQQHVRRQAKWSDPYFWAGFQLISMARMGDNTDGVSRRRE